MTIIDNIESLYFIMFAVPFFIFFVHMAGPYILMVVEDITFGKPAPGRLQNASLKVFLSSYLKIRGSFYLVGPLMLWLAFNFFLTFLSTTMAAPEVDYLSEKINNIIVAAESGLPEESRKKIQELMDLKINIPDENRIRPIDISGMTISIFVFCLIRIAAVRYHPFIGVGLMMMLILHGLVILLLSLVFPTVTEEIIVSSVQRSELPFIIFILTTLGTLCGFINESLLWFRPRAWGRPAGSPVVPGARYVCIICGTTASKYRDNDSRVKLLRCEQEHSKGLNSLEGTFRRESAGW